MYETLIWEETFPGCSLNEHNWNRRVGNWQLSSDGQPVVPGWGNQEQQYYTPNNLEVSDGTLKIIARQEEAPVWDPLSIYLSPNRYPWEILLSVRASRVPCQMFCWKWDLASSLDAAGG